MALNADIESPEGESVDFAQLQAAPNAAQGQAASTGVGTGFVLSVSQGGTGSTSASGALSALGAAKSGVNADITSLTGLSGDVVFSAVGSALKVKEGTNAFMGVATLVAGTATVNNTRVTNNSRIFLMNQDGGGTPGAVYVSSRVAGTSFTITRSR